MEIGETLYVINRDDWRAWLEKNAETSDEIWLIYYNKKSGKPRIAYDEAVEEALCFGWIDSIVKKVDHDRAIEGARSRPEEFDKRLKYFIKMTRQNKKFGSLTD
ncbi:MAG: hypothetical protein H6Q27_1094 [Ignavibacteriaceae bacterium]|nr:hypothetical protein [Ignavibacteriaceae bacterium]